MEQAEKFVQVLKNELMPALGCTEPIAIALASAKARATLGMTPEKLELYCSGNVVKNVMGVTVPNSGGLKGIDVAGAMGVVCGNEEKELEVLEGATPEDIEKATKMIADGRVICSLQEGVDNLYVRAIVTAGEHTAEVTMEYRHTFISDIKKDGECLYHQDPGEHSQSNIDKSFLTIEGILEFAKTVDIEKIREPLDDQIEMNSRISKEGLDNTYGAQIGKTLLQTEGDNVRVRARASAAAGSDARMGGCSYPVVINSGSGNQGLTVSLPVIEYAKELNVSKETLYRALVISNLVAIYQKYFIGNLSAFCGAVSAACGAGAAITYMAGGTDEQISVTIINTLANTSGIVCDGAKASCAAKISSSVEAAILGHNMSMKGIRFMDGDGIVQEDAEKTIRAVGHIGKVGMKQTDVDILNIMLGKVE